MSSKFEAVIGLEVHAELLTETKIFCPCKAEFGASPNKNVCPVCAGMPGALPVLNEKVVEYAILAGSALNCVIPQTSKFDRKNYFYPDLPKAYQISQYDEPICGPGWIEIRTGDQTRKIGITRIHMEEDAGKLVHQGAAGLAGSTHSWVDLNRAGIPLLEIVSEPDLRTPEEAKAYMQELRSILVYLGINDGRLEQGSLRCDANVSIRPLGASTLGTKTEIKNMNSFSAIERAVRYEIQRQIDAVECGEAIVQETRLWNEEKQISVSMRIKEGSADYRYFPDPDLRPLEIAPDRVATIAARLPELPTAKRERYQNTFGLSSYDAAVLVSEKTTADFFDAAVAAAGSVSYAKAIANWLIGDIAAWLNSEKRSLEQTKLRPQHLADLVQLISQETISGKIAKSLLPDLLDAGEDLKTLIEKRGLSQISDDSAINAAITQILEAHPAQVAEFLAGKTKVVGFLVGQVMRATQGRAKPESVNRLLLAALESAKG
ncbi:MAG: Asp-tRNA(Asn)/Glu-tRNA(Gln) amidotransferase subunit GatB [Candidatus Sericytochromatia bacterium]|nr:Asp-tRNA(Asn)/Glu-tRNA(Gln) amidotransferase subunit GatB [Candidatus Sericytochromatia bacterium]